MTNDPDVPQTEFYTLPSLEDVDYWEKFIAAGLHQPKPEPAAASANGSGNYSWIDLADPAYAIAPDPPTIQGILYAARRHVISGPPESTKTLIAYMLLLEALRAQQGVAILDFEMGPHAAATLLRELGATPEELAQIQYTEPNGPPTTHDITRIDGLGCKYVLIDAAAGAYDVTGLDDNHRKDAEKFAAKWIRPLWQAEIATIVIDHVTKDTDTRGKFTIGSERKTGQADVHLSLEALKPLHRGGTGMVKIHVHKDRPGHLPRPTVYVVTLTSDPETHTIGYELGDPHPVDEQGEFRPTIYMERVSRELQKHTEPLSRNGIEEAVKGKRDYVRDALNWLVRDGHVSEGEGARGARLYTLLKPYTQPENDLAPTSPPPRPGEDRDDFAPEPLIGVPAGRGQSAGEATSPRPEPEVQKQLDEGPPDGIPF